MPSLDFSALNFDALLEREWLVSNHLGGYASSTVCSLNTRKYHGLLVAAMAPPVRRLVLLSRVEETVHAKGWPCPLACNEYPGTIHPQGHQSLKAFSYDPNPRWAYQGHGWAMEKSLQLLSGQNTVVLTYTLLNAAGSVDFDLRPLFALRPIHELMYQWNGSLGAQRREPRQHRVPPTSRTPELFFSHDGTFDSSGTWYLNTIYRREQDRGYAGLEDLWSPGIVRWTMSAGQSVHFVCSADPIDFEAAVASARSDREVVRIDPPADATLDVLVRSANRFLVSSSADSAARSINVITQYHWSAPSARDALIAFGGLFLVTGRFSEARALLESLASRVQHGLIPTRFAEDHSEPQYTGADTSLWFINAVWEYLRYTNDDAVVSRRLLDVVLEIVQNYRHGTKLGITTDSDGLLISRAPGIPTTWMDAKVGDWVITPRAGRAVEINALWYNALRIAHELSERFGHSSRAHDLAELASKVESAFNRRFWNEAENCCFDVVDDHGSDPSIRPNQLLAISLPFPVLAIQWHADVLKVVKRELLTPLGLRTLSPKDPPYQGRYGGNVVSRDRACHQGSAYPWLLGPWVTALLRVHGRGQRARSDALRSIQPCIEHMRTDGLGHLCELFDGDRPHRPGGAIASALSVGAILQAYVQEILDQAPARLPTSAKSPQWTLRAATVRERFVRDRTG